MKFQSSNEPLVEPIQGGYNMNFPDGEIYWYAVGDILEPEDFDNIENFQSAILWIENNKLKL